jgi:tetratricopeptide (TPR) repeat protein
MIWIPWLNQLRDLPASEPQWVRLPAFLDAVKQIADEKRKQQEEYWHPLRQALAELQNPECTQEISYFELSPESWSAEACPPTEAKGVAEQVNEFESQLYQHAKLRHQTCQTRTEDLHRRETLSSLASQLLKLYTTLTQSLTEVGISNLLKLRIKNKNWAEAERLIEHALSAPIEDTEMIKQLGIYYRKRYQNEGDETRLQEGLQTFNQLLETGANRPAALAQLAYFQYVLGAPETAEDSARKAIVESEMDIAIIAMVGWFYDEYLRNQKGGDPSTQVAKLFDAVLAEVELLPFAKQHIALIKSTLENQGRDVFIWLKWLYRIFSDLESEGDMQCAKEQEPQAQECYQVALEYNEVLIWKNSRQFRCHSNRSRIYRKMGNTAKATKHAKRAIRLGELSTETIGNDPPLIDLVLSIPIEDAEVFKQLGNDYRKRYLDAGNETILREGLDTFNQLLETGANRPATLAQLAYFHDVLGDSETADRCAREAIVESEMDIEIIAMVAWFYDEYLKNQKQVDPSERIENLFNRVITNIDLQSAKKHIDLIKSNLSSEDADIFIWFKWLYRIFADLDSQGDRLYAEGQETQAQECYQVALEYNEVLIEVRPEFPNNHYNRTKIYRKINDSNIIQGHLEKTVSFYIRHQDYAKADEYNEKLLSLEPTDKVYLTNKGKIRILQGREEAAEQIFAELAKAQQDPVAHFYLGKIHRKRGALDKALQSFRESYDLGKNIVALDQMAAIYRRKGDFDVGIELYTQILEKDKSDHRAMFGLALIYYQRSGEGDIEQAVRGFAQVLELNPSDVWTARKLVDCCVSDEGLKKIKSILQQGGQYVRWNIIHRLTEANLFHEELIPAMEGVLTNSPLSLKLQATKYFMRYTIYRYFYDETESDFEAYLRRQFRLLSCSCYRVEDYSMGLVQLPNS